MRVSDFLALLLTERVSDVCVCLLLDKTGHFIETWPLCNFAKATKRASPMCSRAGFFSVAAAATAASGTTAAAASTAGVCGSATHFQLRTVDSAGFV